MNLKSSFDCFSCTYEFIPSIYFLISISLFLFDDVSSKTDENCRIYFLVVLTVNLIIASSLIL